MKKVILALAIVSVAFVACNNEGETKEAKTDSPAVEAPKTDSVAPKADSATAPKADSAAAPKADSAAAKK